MQLVVENGEARDATVDHRDPACGECLPFGGAEFVRVREEGDVVRPLAQEVHMLDRARVGAEHADRLVADFPAVAVRAVEEVAAPALTGAGDVRKLVDGTGCEQDASRLQHLPAGEPERERAIDLHDLVLDEVDVVAAELAPPAGEELGGRHPVAREEAVHVRGRRVARRPGVDHDDTPPGAAEHKRCAQTGGTAADHRHVVALGLHVHDPTPAPPCTPGHRGQGNSRSTIGSNRESSRAAVR